MQKGAIKYLTLAVAALLLISFGAAGSASAATTEKKTISGSMPVVWQGDIPLSDLEFLIAYLQDSNVEIPQCLMDELISVYAENGAVHISINGVASYSLTVCQKDGMQDAVFQGCWRGTISLQVGEICVKLNIKCASLLIHTIGDCRCDNYWIIINFVAIAKAEIKAPCGTQCFDLKFDIHIKIRNGEICVWSLYPEWLAGMFPEPDQGSLEFFMALFPANSKLSWEGILV
jgi:hypothetical protein